MSILFPVAMPCLCGSDKPRRELRDALNIFCAFVCDGCEAEKRAEFDLRIFTANPYPAGEPIEED